jgi:hypothetical protein
LSSGNPDSIKIERTTIESNNYRIPAVLLQPDHPRGVAVVMHSYGGSKEEMIGLGFRVAEAGLIACIIDYRGHGQNPIPLNTNILKDVTAAINFCRTFGKVTAIGHSLGGRLALLSDADYRIGISPSLDKEYSEHTWGLLKKMRSYRVDPPEIDPLCAVQNYLPVWNSTNDTRNTTIIYGERDVEEIITGCEDLNDRGVKTFRIPAALHQDIFLLEETFSIIRNQIQEWYGRV